MYSAYMDTLPVDLLKYLLALLPPTLGRLVCRLWASTVEDLADHYVSDTERTDSRPIEDLPAVWWSKLGPLQRIRLADEICADRGLLVAPLKAPYVVTWAVMLASGRESEVSQMIYDETRSIRNMMIYFIHMMTIHEQYRRRVLFIHLSADERDSLPSLEYKYFHESHYRMIAMDVWKYLRNANDYRLHALMAERQLIMGD